MSYIKEKHLATIKALEAYGSAIQVYYYDPTDLSRLALQACRNTLEKMLEPYYMNEQAESTEAKGE